ncbi:MAG TPA: RHS repeat-associated core domain-containing protein [Pyrinomonadaceae bacterium]|nr:RHS repeat-associated core domain-containing protein [Pyrinomonadaceae bacterium]
MPPAFAASRTPSQRGATAGSGLASRGAAGGPARMDASAPAAEAFGVVLTPLNTAFNDHAGVEYHQHSRSVVVSANSPTGQPHNFELLDGGGAHHAFSNVGGLGGALKLAAARDDGQGASLGGFQTGELFTGTGEPGVIARVSPDGGSVQNPWVTLPGEAGLPAGLHVDRTGVFGGDLVVVTEAGGVWRINAAGVAAQVASLNTPLAGVTTIPDDADRYGPWAGKILTGAKEQGAVHAIDAQGGASPYPLGVNPEEIEIVPAHENFFGLDPADGRLWGAPADAFAGLVGDVLVAQGSPGVLARVRWNGTEFEAGEIARVAKWGQITFAPAGVAEVRGVKQVYDRVAVVRRAPVINSGRVEGALWQLTAETVALDGTDTITSDLLVPGSPTVKVGAGRPSFAGVIEGVEDSQPTGYSVSIGGNAALRHLITRTNPMEPEPVAPPPAPAGARDVSITGEGQGVGDFSALRDLSLSGKAGAVSVPPGTYGSFTLGGRTALVLGSEHSAEPAVYNLQSLTLAGGSELRLAGPVVLTVMGDVSLTGSTVGAADDPRRLLLKVAEGAVKVGGGGVLYGVVRAPRGAVEIAGQGRVRGTVMCDRLTVGGNGVLQVTESDVPPPPVNRPPAVDAGPDQSVRLPADTLSLNGTASDDGLPRGGALDVVWSVASGPGPVGFGNPASAATTATFVEHGAYVLKLTASDGQLTRSDEVRVEVAPRNQPPTAGAGPDQTVTLPDSAALSGTVTDDAAPGFPLSVSWEKVSGPGAVAFGSPDRATTAAAFDADGTYVLRLTASDTELSASDEVTVTVLPRPNRPPQITSTPVVEFTPGQAPPGDGELVDLAPWSVQQFGSGGAHWVKDAANHSVTQLHNSDPTMLLSDFNLGDGQMEGTWRVETTSDDDLMGFVFGYQGPGRFYLFDWKQSDQPDGLGFAERGMSLKVFNAATPPGGADFWPTDGNGPRVRTLYHNTVPWEDFTDYHFTLQFRPGRIRIVVRQGEAVLADFTVNDATYADGRFGFYNYSQEAVKYSGFRRASLARGTYAYDVEAADPDGDALTYSLDAAPAGMTIDPVTGLITWPVTPNEAGRHSVAVRVRDPGGASDTQSYTLNIINPAEGPAFKVYTLDADFDQGSFINVTRGTPDQLQLDETARNFNFIWVAVSSKGTIVKIDTETGAVLGEYFTSPAGQWRNPSRTTVDHNGNVWATNRDGNSVLRVGLAENGQCVDRNGNGRIDTSRGFGDVRPWTNAGGADTGGGVSTAEDECVINYTKVRSSGTRHVSVTKDNDVWVSGTFGQHFDLIDGKTGQIKRTESSVGFGGYGGLIDRNGVIWSARPLLRWDTSKPLTGPNGGNWNGYFHDSYGLCIDSKGNVWNTSLGGNLIYKFAPDGTHLGTFNHGSNWAQGCVVDKNDDVWVAHSLYDSSVGHIKSNGVFVGNVAVGSGPTGVAVDAKGKIWATNHNSWNVSRIDPNLGPVGADGVTRVGAVDFTSQALGGYLYNYSDMTGSTLSGAPEQGTWTAVFDSGRAGAEWGRVGWTARVCGDGLLTVSVATGEDGSNFSQPVTVSNGDDPDVPAGRYAKVSVKFERAASGESPVLYDLTVATAGFELDAPANAAPEVNAGPDQTLEGVTKTALDGSACDDALPSNRRLSISWSKVSGPGAATFARPNSATTEVTFDAVGTYELKLTAADSVHARSDAVLVEVLPGNGPPAVNAGPDRTVTHPDAAALQGTVADDGLPRGGSLLVTWSKVSGPGGVTFSDERAASTTARFGAPGTYVLRLTASDTEFAAHDELAVTVEGTNQPPAVNAGPDRTITLPNTASLEGTAADDGWPEGSPLSVSWDVVSGPGAVGFNNPNQAATAASFAEPGDYVLRLTAGDSLLSASDEVSVTVNPAVPPPVASLGGLPDGAEVTTRVAVTGTVSAGSNWQLQYAHGDGGGAVWTTLASGNTPVNNGPLGVFDPTLLLNGTYTLRLVATDAAAQTTAASVSLVVAGEQKIGNFSLSFSDLRVPVGGLPIEVTRTYDSRDKRNGDFGVGWTLGIKNVRVEKSGVLGEGWEQTRSGGFIPTYCLQPRRPNFVTVTFPDGKVHRFQTVTGPQCSALTPIQSTTVGFAPLPGTRGSLIALAGGDALVTGEAPGPVELRDFDGLDLYNPTRFRYTAEDGTAFVIDQALGVLSVADPHGNTLTLGRDGIAHSSGRSVTFTRDAQGRITGITDPSGNALTYAYDARGDLVAYQDREANQITFTYNSAHGLLDIKDPRGVRPVRNEYDDAGRLIKHVDAFGKQIVYTHDLDGRREVITDRLARVTVVEYNQRGNVVKTIDPQGNVKTATYDDRGNKLSETNAAGKTTSYTYDARDNRTAVTDPLGNVTRFAYDSRSQLLTATDPQGRVTSHSYSPAGAPLSTTDPLGNTTTSTYNAAGLLETTTDADGHVARYEYDADGRAVREIDPSGRVSSYTYDANGNRLSQTLTRTAPDGTAQALTTSFGYDRLGRLTRVTLPDGTTAEHVYDSSGRKVADVDQLGRRTSYEFDEMGRLVRTTFPDGTKAETAYDAEGRPVKETDAAGRETAFTYDSLGRLEKVTHPDGTFTTTTYDSIGRATAAFDERGHRTAFEYDPGCGCADRLTKVTDPLGHATTFTYDASGNRVSMTDARGNTVKFEYDELGRRTRVVFPDGTSASADYDALGRPVSKTDQAGKTTRYEYDKLGRLAKVLDALDQATTFTYDEVGNLLSQTDANNHATRFEYDRMGRRVKRTLPLGMSETYAYDASGQLTSRTGFDGKTTTYAYDAMGRLLSKTPDPSLGQPAVVYAYDAQGLRVSMSDASGLTTYAYDALDRLKSKATPQGTLTYAYDAAGNLTSARSSNERGLSAEYAYDALDRLTAVTDLRLGAGRTVYDYDEVGNLSGYAYPNGVRTAHTYDSLNRLTGLGSGKDSTLASYAYALGPAGNRLSVTELSGRRASYTYDELYRLTGESVSSDPHGKDGSVSYTYDAVGNRKSRRSSLPGVADAAHEYDANDRLASDAYDANGNTLSSGGKTYRFDFEDRLTEVNGGEARFVYNGDGQRVAKTAGGVTTEYLVDDNNLTGYAQVVEELQGGDVQRVYTYGHSLISQNQLLGGEWSASFYGYDGHGSVRYLTDASGAVTDTYDYDAFGTLVHRAGTTPNNYLYAGEQFDEHLGMLYLRARYLNLDTGRFFTRDVDEGNGFDPVSLHKYLYANADPVNMSDPSGYRSIGEMAATFRIWTITAMAGLASRLVAATCLRGSIAVILAAGFTSGLYSGLDSLSDGGDFFVPFANGFGAGATFAVVFLTFPELQALLPILTLYGINAAVEGVGESVGKGNYVQAALRLGSAFAMPYLSGRLQRFLAGRQVAPQTNSKPAPAPSSEGPPPPNRDQWIKDFLQSVTNRAEKAIGGRGPVPGTHKHKYAENLINRFQSKYGDHGLRTETSWLNKLRAAFGQRGSARPDVWDAWGDKGYDFKFIIDPARQRMSLRQIEKTMRNGPLYLMGVEPIFPR